ncbi:MAG: ATP-binding cassette domain-containing protein [Candidatus Heimdallarchaeota archaeon]|nr:ATP-binding cassette domain-containing protein [Candidatus Heimdallarchaeota archaeon]
MSNQTLENINQLNKSDNKMLIECKDLIKVYQDEINKISIPALRGCDLRLKKGELVSIVGPSGSGKTTLIKIIAGMDFPTSGLIKVANYQLETLPQEKLKEYRLENISLIDQFPERTLFLNISVSDNLEFSENLKKKQSTATNFRYMDILDKLGISYLEDRIVKTLSGGEMTRVALACAITKNTPIILCDEPTGQLDSLNTERVKDLLFNITREFGKTILVVTHDPRFIDGVDTSLEIKDGRVSSILSSKDKAMLDLKADYPMTFRSHIDSTKSTRIPDLVYRSLKLADSIDFQLDKEGKVLIKNPEEIPPELIDFNEIKKEKIFRKVINLPENYFEKKEFAISLQKTSKVYKTLGGEVYALSDFSLNIPKGELVFVIGPSGSGKTTLMNIISGMVTESSGEIMINDVLFSELSDEERAIFRRNAMGIVGQQGNLNPYLSIDENLDLKEIYKKTTKARSLSLEEEKKLLMDRFQIVHRRNSYPLEISGGELQRASLALAFQGQPKILLLDEPTANLDSELGYTVMDLVFTYTRENKITTIVSTHDINLLQDNSRVIELKDGKIEKDGLCKLESK